MYYDASYDPFWEKVQELDAPVYLHPSDPHVVPQAYSGHPELVGACWGWGVETATHALRLLFGGVFDRYPGVKLILGHMGEGRHSCAGASTAASRFTRMASLERAPSAYLGSNIVITTSGVCSPPTTAAIAEMGREAVMFSVDYPYESTALAVEFIEQTPMDEATRALICHGNARRLFKL